MYDEKKRAKYKYSQSNAQKINNRKDAQMIDQLFNSVKKSEKAIQDTLKSIDATMKFIKKMDEKETHYQK